MPQCRLALFFRAFWLLPSLPDPYAANFDTVETIRSQESGKSFEILLIEISGVGLESAEHPTCAGDLRNPEQGLDSSKRSHRAAKRGGLVLLDLSSRADLFGVKLALTTIQLAIRAPAKRREMHLSFGFTGLSLAFNQGLLADVRTSSDFVGADGFRGTASTA